MKRSFSQPSLKVKRDDDKSSLEKSVSYIEQLNPQCSICQNILLFPCTLGCGHSFCYRCLKDLHKHVHADGNHYESSDDSGDEHENQEQNHEDGNVKRTAVNRGQAYKNTFFDDQCFRSVIGGKFKSNFSSELLLNKSQLLTHILQDSIFCDNCPGLKCPTCRLKVKVLPKPNILLHESLKQLLGQLYDSRVEDYLSSYSQDFMLEQYEQSDRFKTIKMLVSESIGAIQQAVTFSNLMDSFSAYDEVEIVWCLSKLLKENTFIIVKDIIISNSYYSSDFNKLLTAQKLTSDDINYLIVSHPHFSLGYGDHTQQLIQNLKKRFKGGKSGVLGLLDDEETLHQSIRECIANNNLLNW